MQDSKKNATPYGGAASQTTWERKTIEKVLMELAKEQKARRRWRFFSRLFWFLLIAGVYALLFFGMRSAQNAPQMMGQKNQAHTAVVEIKGAIMDGEAAGAGKVLPALQEAFENEHAKAVVLLVNSPGGSPVQAGIISDEIYRLKAKHEKPVYAVVEETCASAAYYIASAADNIYADKASLVGSIGVLMNGFGFTGTMEKLGVERRLMTAGEHKAIMDPFSPQNEFDKQHIQEMLDEIHVQFIDVVKKGRGDRLKGGDELFSGLFWNGERALELGLIDGISNTGAVARDIVQAEKMVTYSKKNTLAEQLAEKFGTAVGKSAVQGLGVQAGAQWQ